MITVKLLSEPGVMLAPSQCPVCGGDDVHKKGCVLDGLEHVYVGPDHRVDWGATFKRNRVAINRNPTAERRRR